MALLFGNVWFAWLATRLATKENRLDVTQPYGMNTTVIYITIYAISLPAIQAGFSKYNPGTGASDADSIALGKKAAEFGWKVSVGVNFIIGFMEILGCFLGDIIRNTVPTAGVYVPRSRASASSGSRSPPCSPSLNLPSCASCRSWWSSSVSLATSATPCTEK